MDLMEFRKTSTVPPLKKLVLFLFRVREGTCWTSLKEITLPRNFSLRRTAKVSVRQSMVGAVVVTSLFIPMPYPPTRDGAMV